ncbi:MAG: hypothetical protein ABR499_08265 [Gemmatimonadaceae bacterium]
MSHSSCERLFELFAWEHRDLVYRVRFQDGDEFDLTLITAGQDDGEPPHGIASVVRTVRRRDGTEWPERNAMFFHLPEIAEVADPASGNVLYRAG